MSGQSQVEEYERVLEIFEGGLKNIAFTMLRTGQKVAILGHLIDGQTPVLGIVSTAQNPFQATPIPSYMLFADAHRPLPKRKGYISFTTFRTYTFKRDNDKYKTMTEVVITTSAGIELRRELQLTTFSCEGVSFAVYWDADGDIQGTKEFDLPDGWTQDWWRHKVEAEVRKRSQTPPHINEERPPTPGPAYKRRRSSSAASTTPSTTKRIKEECIPKARHWSQRFPKVWRRIARGV